MIRLKISGKILIVLLILPCAVVFYSVFRSFLKQEELKNHPVISSTPGLAVFRRQEDKPEEVSIKKCITHFFANNILARE